jgi:NADH-quinone oxidoreductase subunit N
VIPVAATHLHGPHIDWAALSPLVALLAGATIVLLVGLMKSPSIRSYGVPLLSLAALGVTLGLTIGQWNAHKSIVSGALAVDDLTLAIDYILIAAGVMTVLLSWRSEAQREASPGEYNALLLTAIAGMSTLVAAQNLITLFIGLELLSIPLYVLCATEMRRQASLEAGLKYLIVGSVGSATFLYGLTLIYGATGATDFSAIASSIDGARASDPLLLTGVALAVAGLAFKGSVAPFHQWTPDVYEGAPTPITTFMSVATKAAAFGAFLRLFDVALIQTQIDWGPALAVLATISIVIGNVGALGQSSLKRMLAYSSIAQAGYILAGVVVSTRLGLQATVFYLVVYLLMNVAAFAVVIARERETKLGDDIDAIAGIGAHRPWLAWPLTIAMLGLAGIPGTAGLIGKIYLIDAASSGGYTWLGLVIVVGSMISLGYYLRVIAAIWMRPALDEGVTARPPVTRPAIAGGSHEADSLDLGTLATPRPAGFEVTVAAVVCAAATIFFGVIPQPLFDLMHGVGGALPGLF